MHSDRLVELDQRGRISLGRYLPKDERWQFYLVEVHEDGSITLTPAVAMPASAVQR